jgi:pimeloyl-ACP methyl ester carboxylesterase/DNA-binding CsgD family transcriptional regulator
MRQQIRFLETADGVHLAWARAGNGPVLVKPSCWLTHLEYDWESPVWRHWMRFLAGHYTFVRYDERGCGLTDWAANDLAADRWIDDLEAVVERAGLNEPFVLLGISQGSVAAIQYAVRHPERVSKLVLYGGYARGWGRRGDPGAERAARAIIDLMETGWGSDNPVFRQLFTSRFIPGATAEQIRWFNDLCRRTTSPEVAMRLNLVRRDVDITALLPQVRIPTLVMHARDDAVVPLAEGRLLAAHIPNAQFVELDSGNHVLLEDEPAWRVFQNRLIEYTGASPRHTGFDMLSAREREILALMADGCSNVEIGERLFISEKTVRNHATSLFAKLGVTNRAQAIVLARDHAFVT